MIATLLKALFGVFASDAGSKIGGKAIDLVAIAAIAVPAWNWFLGHKEEMAVCLTWGQAVFCGLIVFAVVMAARFTQSPGPAPAPWYRQPPQ